MPPVIPRWIVASRRFSIASMRSLAACAIGCLAFGAIDFYLTFCYFAYIGLGWAALSLLSSRRPAKPVRCQEVHYAAKPLPWWERRDKPPTAINYFDLILSGDPDASHAHVYNLYLTSAFYSHGLLSLLMCLNFLLLINRVPFLSHRLFTQLISFSRPIASTMNPSEANPTKWNNQRLLHLRIYLLLRNWRY